MAEYVVDGRLKYFSRIINNEGTLHILLVSVSQCLLELLAENLYFLREIQRQKRSYNLKVHTCKTIVDVITYMPADFSVDFIVFVVDTSNINCLLEVQNNLALLDSSFTREKICLINPDANYQKSLVPPMDVWDFATQHQYNLINGKITDERSKINLSKRILNLAEACCGILNGIPMVNIV